jgi:hypothetical protein
MIQMIAAIKPIEPSNIIETILYLFRPEVSEVQEIYYHVFTRHDDDPATLVWKLPPILR